MRTTKTLLDYMAEDCWTIRIPKPRLSAATVRWTAALALSLGFNVGFLLGCAPATTEVPKAPVSAPSAEALEEVPEDQEQFDEGGAAMCDNYAEQAWQLTKSDTAWEDAYAACSSGLGTFEEAWAWSKACDSETSWVTPDPSSGMYSAHCGDADGNEVF